MFGILTRPRLWCCAIAPPVAVWLLTACGQGQGQVKDGAAAARQDEPRPVRVARADVRPLERTIAAIGSLLAHDQSILSVKVPGHLEELPVDLGSLVTNQQVVARIDRRDYELKLRHAESMLAQARARLGLPLEGSDDRVDPEKTSTVKQARALLDEARKNRDRVARLRAEAVLADAELETAQSAFDVALNRNQDAIEEIRNRQALLAQRRVEHEIARQQLTDCEIRAPFTGVVQDRMAQRGEFLNVGAPVTRLVRVDPLRVRLEVSERDAARIALGQEVRAEVEGETRTYSGRLSRLSPMIQTQNRMLIVEADIPRSGSLRPGLFVRAQIVVATNEPAVIVPPDAVFSFAGFEKIMVVEGGKAVEREVTTGRRGPGWVEVAGLRAGELVIREPGSLRTGQPVKVRSDS